MVCQLSSMSLQLMLGVLPLCCSLHSGSAEGHQQRKQSMQYICIGTGEEQRQGLAPQQLPSVLAFVATFVAAFVAATQAVVDGN